MYTTQFAIDGDELIEFPAQIAPDHLACTPSVHPSTGRSSRVERVEQTVARSDVDGPAVDGG